MNTDERQRTNVARIELARAARELRVARVDDPSTRRALGRMERALVELAPTGGLSVAEAATTFEVSAPTIRKWIREGMLEPIPSTSPQRVTFESVERLDEIVDRVRDSLPERDRTKALAAYLHDRDLLNMPWAKDGIAASRVRRPEDRVKL